MKYSGIGGQAVMEGVMMRNGAKYALAVRKPDRTIAVETHTTKDPSGKIYQIPILRGIISFVDSLVLGMSTLMKSASYFEDEEETEAGAGTTAEGEAEVKTPKKRNTDRQSKEQKEKKEKMEMGITVAVALVLAVAIFMVLPYFLSRFLGGFITSPSLLALVEGLIRIGIFVLYVAAISRMEDIRRVFMYHGAEHKCINCIEHGLELNVENVRRSSKQHKRCGTSFLLFVFLVSVVVFMFIRFDSPVLQLVCRLLLIPVVAGISYEIIRLAGRSDSALVNVLSKPGLLLQNLTTKEPDDEMIQVGIASVEAVFDWRAFQRENFSDSTDAWNPDGEMVS